MTIESMIALAFATFVFACIPGPGVSAVIAQSLARGFGAGVSFAGGLVCGDLVYLLTAIFGMGWIASAIGPWFVVLKWAGAAYLFYMGIQCWRAKPPTAQDASSSLPTRKGQSFLAGLCVTLGNPKVIAFYCGFLPGFVDMPKLAGIDVFFMVGIIIPIVFSVIAMYAWLAGRGRKVVRSTKIWKIANRSAGTVMIGAGLAVASE